MDFTILFAIGIVLITIAIIFGVKYLKNKNMIDEQSLQMAADALNLSVLVLKELNLKNEKELVKIANIVAIALDVAIDSIKTNEFDLLLEKAKENAYKACALYELELNDNRKMIINQLLEVCLRSRLAKKVD